jgi:hypothetical protein
MTTQLIPVQPLPYSTQTTTLDGVPYFLTFRWNARESCYYLQIQSADQTITYAQGVKLVSDFFLLYTYPTPPGDMMVLTSGGGDGPAQIGDFGPRCSLLYVEAADVFAGGLNKTKNPSIDEP